MVSDGGVVGGDRKQSVAQRLPSCMQCKKSDGKREDESRLPTNNTVHHFPFSHREKVDG